MFFNLLFPHSGVTLPACDGSVYLLLAKKAAGTLGESYLHVTCLVSVVSQPDQCGKRKVTSHR